MILILCLYFGLINFICILFSFFSDINMIVSGRPPFQISCSFQCPALLATLIFAFFSVIHHFHISYNAPYLPVKILHNLCVSFVLGITVVILGGKFGALWEMWKSWIAFCFFFSPKKLFSFLHKCTCITIHYSLKQLIDILTY